MKGRKAQKNSPPPLRRNKKIILLPAHRIKAAAFQGTYFKHDMVRLANDLLRGFRDRPRPNAETFRTRRGIHPYRTVFYPDFHGPDLTPHEKRPVLIEGISRNERFILEYDYRVRHGRLYKGSEEHGAKKKDENENRIKKSEPFDDRLHVFHRKAFHPQPYNPKININPIGIA